LYAVGIGIAYWPPVICAWEWFPERKGLISGLIIGSYGLGAFFYNFITSAIVNPNNILPSI